MNKKLLLSMTAGLLLLSTAVIIPLSNNNAHQLSFVTTRKSVAAPAEVNYQGFHKITKTTTLVDKCEVVFVRNTTVAPQKTFISTTTSDSHNLVAVESASYIGPNGHFNHDDAFTYMSVVQDAKTYATFNANGKTLEAHSTTGFDMDTNPISHLFDINISAGQTSIKAKNAYYVTFSSSQKGFPAFFQENANNKYVDLYVNVDSVVEAWAQKYLKPKLDVEGQCVGLFPAAKSALLAMDDFVISDLYYNTKNDAINGYKQRYESWAKALGQQPYQE